MNANDDNNQEPQYIVSFWNTNDADFMRWVIGPFATEEAAEEERLNFIRDMDDIDEFSAVYEGAVLEMRPYPYVSFRIGNTLLEGRLT